MLEITINECVSQLELRRFVTDNDERYHFFASPTHSKKVSKKELPMLDARLDMRRSAAERIYDIRCRIVHAKAEFDAEVRSCPPIPRRSTWASTSHWSGIRRAKRSVNPDAPFGSERLPLVMEQLVDS